MSTSLTLASCRSDGLNEVESASASVATTAMYRALSEQELEALLIDVEGKVPKRFPGRAGIAVAKGHENAVARATEPL